MEDNEITLGKGWSGGTQLAVRRLLCIPHLKGVEECLFEGVGFVDPCVLTELACWVERFAGEGCVREVVGQGCGFLPNVRFLRQPFVNRRLVMTLCMFYWR